MNPQAINPAVAIIFNNQVKALLPSSEHAKYPNAPNAVNKTAKYGTPPLLVLRKI